MLSRLVDSLTNQTNPSPENLVCVPDLENLSATETPHQPVSENQINVSHLPQSSPGPTQSLTRPNDQLFGINPNKVPASTFDSWMKNRTDFSSVDQRRYQIHQSPCEATHHVENPATPPIQHQPVNLDRFYYQSVITHPQTNSGYSKEYRVNQQQPQIQITQTQPSNASHQNQQNETTNQTNFSNCFPRQPESSGNHEIISQQNMRNPKDAPHHQNQPSSEGGILDICPICSNSRTRLRKWTCCDMCDQWYHDSCLGKNKVLDKENKFYCLPCKRKSGSSPPSIQGNQQAKPPASVSGSQQNLTNARSNVAPGNLVQYSQQTELQKSAQQQNASNQSSSQITPATIVDRTSNQVQSNLIIRNQVPNQNFGFGRPTQNAALDTSNTNLWRQHLNSFSLQHIPVSSVPNLQRNCDRGIEHQQNRPQLQNTNNFGQNYPQSSGLNYVSAQVNFTSQNGPQNVAGHHFSAQRQNQQHGAPSQNLNTPPALQYYYSIEPPTRGGPNKNSN